MLYPIIVATHNAMRWLVVGSLIATLVSGYSGWLRPRSYRPADQTLRVVTTSLLHVQLLIGIYLYTLSPIIRYYWKFHPSFGDAIEFPFFSLIHSSLMFVAVVIMTIGSSTAKRLKDDQQKFKTTAIYFTIGFVLLILAVPWPFSPLVNRPWFRLF